MSTKATEDKITTNELNLLLNQLNIKGKYKAKRRQKIEAIKEKQNGRLSKPRTPNKELKDMKRYELMVYAERQRKPLPSIMTRKEALSALQKQKRKPENKSKAQMVEYVIQDRKNFKRKDLEDFSRVELDLLLRKEGIKNLFKKKKWQKIEALRKKLGTGTVQKVRIDKSKKYEDMNYYELMALAERDGLKTSSNMNRNDLIKLHKFGQIKNKKKRQKVKGTESSRPIKRLKPKKKQSFNIPIWKLPPSTFEVPRSGGSTFSFFDDVTKR